MWFELKGDSRLGQCATEGCGGQPTWRLEADGVGSNYCSGCKAKISSTTPPTSREGLLACPFCGSPGIVEEIPMGIGHSMQRASCHSCGCTLMLRADVIDAIEAWNKRGGVTQTPWGPIETAPKDGTVIIVFRPTAKKDSWSIPPIGIDFWFEKRCWGKSNRDAQPTHWQPLPSPPNPREAKP